MHRAALAAVALAACSVWTADAHACDCAQPGSPSAELADATRVFLGTPIDTKSLKAEGWDVVTFRVERVWKGTAPRRISVRTPIVAPGMCGRPFFHDERYLVYAYGVEHTSGLETSSCTRTAREEDAKADLVELGTGYLPEQGESDPVSPTIASKRGGCAGCAVAGAESTGPPLLLALALLAATGRALASKPRA